MNIKIGSMIREFGWENLEAPEYADFLKLLYESRLLFSIRGYQNSLDHSEMSEAIKTIDGSPHLLKEGQWTRWDEIVRDFRYDPIRREIVEKKNPTQCWNYLYPNGLVPQTRYDWVGAVHKVSDLEMKALRAQGEKFSTDRADGGRYLQVVSRGETCLSQIGGHIGVRLIDNDGSMYSLGFEIPPIAKKTREIFNILSTHNVSVASLDFTEFRKFDVKRITTIPVDEEIFTKVLDKAKRYAAAPLRHNFLNQNCVDFAIDLLEEAGVKASAKNDSILNYGWEMLPSLGGHKIRTITPECVKNTARRIAYVATFILSFMLTVLKNIVFLTLGANRAGASLKEPRPATGDRLTDHKLPFNQWGDLFRDIPISDPVEMVKWQEAQASTQIHRYAGPKFYI